MSTRTRIACFTVALASVLLSGMSMASAQDSAQDAGSETSEPFVVLTGHLNVEQGITVEDAVIFDGDATIDGDVRGNAVALNGDVTVNGTVNGDVVALNGRVVVAAQGSVDGNVVSRNQPQVDGTVGGEVLRNQFRTDGLVLFGRIAFWLAATISSLLFGLLWMAFFPRAGEAVASVARTKLGASIGIGLLLFLGIPLVGGIMLVTLVGGLFGVALLAGMVLLYTVAYAAGALALGRLIVKAPRKPAVAFLAGWLILRILALVPVLGGFLFAAAAVWGFGAIAIAARRAGRNEDGAARTPVPAQATPPPMPPSP